MSGRVSPARRVVCGGRGPALLATLLVVLVVIAGIASGCGDSGVSQAVTTEVMASASEPAPLATSADGLSADETVPAAAAGDDTPPSTETTSTSSQAPPSATVPAAIAGVPLSGWIGGDQARAQVEELHGKTLGQGMDEAWVAQYGSGQALLWVTRAVRPEDARDLYVRMVDRIAGGGSPFTAQQPIEIPGVEGYSLEGLGQQHYYFLVGGDLYWLAVDAELASAGLEELVAQARTTAEVE